MVAGLLIAGGVGVVLGLALMYGTVIVPRSVELRRTVRATGLARTLDLTGLFAETGEGVKWDTREEDVGGYVYGGMIRGRVIRARGTVPAAEQQAELALIGQRLQSALNTVGGGINRLDASSDVVDGQLYWRQSFGYLTGSLSGTAHLIAVGEGDRLVVVVVFDEK